MPARMDFYRAVRLMLPTVILFFSFRASSFSYSGYTERFHNGDYFLDIYLDTNPEGYFQKLNPSQQIRFRGFFAHPKGEEKIEGVVARNGGATQYIFESALGKFVGARRPEAKGCEPQLDFHLIASDSRFQTGELKPALCR